MTELKTVYIAYPPTLSPQKRPYLLEDKDQLMSEINNGSLRGWDIHEYTWVKDHSEAMREVDTAMAPYYKHPTDFYGAGYSRIPSKLRRELQEKFLATLEKQTPTED